MCWNAPRLRPERFVALMVCLAGVLFAQAAHAQAPLPAPPEGEYEVLLVTYGPGEAYWERFGHNAIWLREPARGLDHAFNFGFFDFDQPHFLRRFVQGRMLYFAAAVPTERELGGYRDAGRSVRVQVLNLGPLEYAQLRDSLLNQVAPENRDYLYDYFYDNCSTRVRDALDLALDGLLAGQFRTQAEVQTLREHARRATERDFWYYLGLEIGLGAPVDAYATRWDEMYLPAVLAENMQEVTRMGSNGLAPLVSEDRLLFEGRVAAMPATPTAVWPRYLALGLGLAVLILLLARYTPAVLANVVATAWLLVAAMAGIGLLALMLGTDHAATRPNINPLLLNPLGLLALVPAWRAFSAMVVVMGVVAAGFIVAWPGGQYLVDVMALTAPLNLAAAWVVWRMGSRR